MKKILVTGGCGFIGSNFIRHMLSKYDDYEIVNLDALTYAGNLDNLKSVSDHPNYMFVKGNITSPSSVSMLMPGVDYVVHFAAESHVDRSIEGPSVFVHTNVVGTCILLEHAKKNDVKKFIHISTDEVYGSLGDEGYFTETTPIAPNSPYSASKAGSDLLVRSYYKTYGFPSTIIRCSNNYGPYQFPEKLIPLMIMNARNDKPLPVYGDGMNVRDWIYVKDHCAAIDAVMHKGKEGEVYNVGSSSERHNIDIVKLILKELGKPESLIEFVEDRLGHDRRYGIDSSKVKNELEWEPTVNFEEGLISTIKWYTENGDWINRIINGEYKSM